ncbi:MAG: hypothetical protein JWO31_2272 [Phycisphaerales bacterium]|nr:hypothetical protein [Phycisphaerales bacterium]
MRMRSLTTVSGSGPVTSPPRRPTAMCRRLVSGVAAVAIAVLIAPRSLSAAEPVPLDKPVRVATTKADKSRLAGRVASYDDQGFSLLDDKDAARTVAWSDLPPKSVMEVYSTLLPKGTAKDWIAAGQVMYQLDGGKDFGERAFARALRLDPQAIPAVEAAKRAAASSKPPAIPSAARGPDGGSTKGKEMLSDDDAVTPKDGFRATSQEEFYKHWWGELTDAEQAESVATLKAFAAKTPKVKDGSLKLFETKYFLFYSDLKPAEATKWANLLDKMNDRLNEMFGVETGRNVWRGKCLTFVFADPNDYHAHERTTYGTDSKGTAGLCHSFGNGYVHVAFYRQPEELEFAHVLVHESVHGFVHRYRSHVNVPSWANEGLAEWIAADLVPQKPRWNDRRMSAIDGLRTHNGVGSTFFGQRNIEAWQYPVAEQLCGFMIQQNKKGYVAFVNGVKDGTSIEDSLSKNFGAPRDRVIAAFIDWMGVKTKAK